MPKIKKLKGKTVYIREDIADFIQLVKDNHKEDKLICILTELSEVILDSDNHIDDIPAEETKLYKPVTLNQDQRIAIDCLNDWFNSDRETATLSGAAGTGKTSAIGHWIQQLGHIDKIICLTPTHKAKNVLMRSLESSTFHPPDVYTVAQALGKQPIIVNTGLEEFQKKVETNLIHDSGLVVVDESSMVSANDYYGIIEKARKVLFMGDKNQLPPVGESNSVAFAAPPTCELHKVMRYKGHILDECQKLRQAAQENYIHKIESDGKQIIRLKCNDALLKATELFKSREFEDDSTFCRVVAYRNKKVDSVNKFIKPRVYGRDDDYFEGLKLIAAQPVQRKNEISREWDIYCNTSEEVRIISAPKTVKIDESVLVDMPKKCKEVRALIGVGKATMFECVSEDGMRFTGLILDKEARDKKIELIKLLQEIYQKKRTKNIKGALRFLYRWGDELKDIFCSTVHKAQGSTYNHVFICLDDILKPPYNKEFQQSDDRPKLLYTAVSRASEKVYLID